MKISSRKYVWCAALAAMLSAVLPSGAQAPAAGSSVLSAGRWYQITVAEAGMYKIAIADLPALEGARCADIAIYGGAGGMLSSDNRTTRPKDLEPCAIEVIDENGNGIFDNADRILFYGEGAGVWRFNERSSRFEFATHAYANNNCYYLTPDAPQGVADLPAMRVQPAPYSEEYQAQTATHTGVALLNEDRINVHSCGQIWVGDKLTASSGQRSYRLDIGTADGVVSARYAFANVSTRTATLTVSAGGSTHQHTFASGEDYQTITEAFAAYTPGNPTFTFSYQPQESGAGGYFDFLELNAVQPMQYTSGPAIFRTAPMLGDAAVCRYRLTAGSPDFKLWDVSDPCQPQALAVAADGGGSYHFHASATEAHTFVAFSSGDAMPPTGITAIDNQDIHGSDEVDYVIVAHRDYVAQAQELADLHLVHDGLRTLVVTQEQVFNEFSSGKADPIAIRMMLRHLRTKSTDEAQPTPRYLLLFGKGTYDNRDLMGAHQTTVVTYQTVGSFDDESNIIPSDDVYGFLDDNDIGYFTGSLSVGIGRLPAKSVAEAEHLVDKLRGYITRRDFGVSSVRGDWRNYVALLADDADPSCPNDTVFASDSEYIARRLKELYPQFNIDRIYADSYIQQSGADGSYYPDVNNALRQRINYGCLLLNYIGHGSSSYIGTERYMEISDIERYTNTDRLPFVVTSTCSFGHYDHLEEVCGAEAILLADAAGIGVVAAARPIHHARSFNSTLCLLALDPANRVGDALCQAKNAYTSSNCITLLGDPALRLQAPHNEVVVTHINGRPVDPQTTDSAEVLSQVTVEGEIRGADGRVLTDFDGTIYPIVFDREVKCRTLANDNDSSEVDFVQQKNVLYKGRENVVGGRFSYSFIIPRDVAYRYDYAKLSHYARNDNDDAAGQYGNIMFGGFNEDMTIAELHPTVELYMGDTNFRPGGITNETPTLHARFTDSVGINAAGSGLGHDITAVIDGNPYSTVTLNDFYEPDINDSRNGEVRYTLGKLDEGRHTLTVKCWNIFNYSGSATIDFVVANDRVPQIGLFTAAPNPAHDRTTLRVEHNLSGAVGAATVDIYDIRGNHLRHFDLAAGEGSCVLACAWDYTDGHGNLLPKGIYVARAVVASGDGQSLVQTAKIVRN